ncbi:MAG: hypothetical protein Q9191_006545 [Dirinaria sp. TL-2023a]
MEYSGSVYSQILDDVTKIKLEELVKKRASFEAQRQQIISGSEIHYDVTNARAIENLAQMLQKMRICFAVSTSESQVSRSSSNSPGLEKDLEKHLKNLDRFLAQARYDPSVSPMLLQQWRQTLLRYLKIHSLKLAYATLYGNLTEEWLSNMGDSVNATHEKDSELEDFEYVSAGKRVEYRANWEKSVFEASNVDQAAITEALRALFESKPQNSNHLLNALTHLRASVKSFEEELAEPEYFTIDTLQWAIKGLIASDLLQEEKRATLRDFVGNDSVLNEIADVLNMRIAALDDWSWGKEVLLEEHRELNGNFTIHMHEDLLQAIFLQDIGTRWSVFWKHAFASFRKRKGVWKISRTSVDHIAKKRQESFLLGMDVRPNYSSRKQTIYREGYFLSQLLDSETEEAFCEEGDEEANFEMHVAKRAMQTAHRSTGRNAPRKQLASKAARKATPSTEDIPEVLDETEDDDYDGSYRPKSRMEAKQNLLHLLSTEILIKTRLHGELTCFRSQIDNLYPSLPHRTIETILEFFGVSKKWLQFFDRFLKAPLRFKDDESVEARLRQNGTPASHVLSDVFGEVVLFCLDFQTNQETGGELLWRMHDDFWFWSSDHATCVKAWASIGRFGRTMGIGVNNARTGAVRMRRSSKEVDDLVPLDVGSELPRGQIRWGMLYLNPTSGLFEIDQNMVNEHILELNRQLANKKENTFAWIQAWNSYAATFFTSNFGKSAQCFGRQHVDNMLATHERIQRQFFPSSAERTISDAQENGGSVIDYLRKTIEQRFGVKDIPDGYFYFPSELGGLEVRNPFIGLLQIRDAVHERPGKLLDDFLEAEKEAYVRDKARFEKLRSGNPTTRHLHPTRQDPGYDAEDTFLSFKEYSSYREELHYGFKNELLEVFTTLLERPAPKSIETADNGNVRNALKALGARPGLRGGIRANWDLMEPYWKWVAQLYGPEMIDAFGGFCVVDQSLLPMGLLSMLRSGRVSWQE